MRVGITENDPWTILGDEPSGVEVDLLTGFAQELGARIDWTEGTEHELFAALELGSLDVVVGGITSTNANSKHASFIHPFHTSYVTVGLPPGTANNDIDGLEVAVEKGTEEAGLLTKTDAVPIYVDDITGEEERPAVVSDWLLDDLGLEDSGVRLSESDHVMAVRFGENGWQVTLEKYLLSREDDIDRLLDEHAP